MYIYIVYICIYILYIYTFPLKTINNMSIFAGISVSIFQCEDIELRYYLTFTLFFCFAVSTILLAMDFFEISLLMLSESKRIN